MVERRRLPDEHDASVEGEGRPRSQAAGQADRRRAGRVDRPPGGQPRRLPPGRVPAAHGRVGERGHQRRAESVGQHPALVGSALATEAHVHLERGRRRHHALALDAVGAEERLHGRVPRRVHDAAGGPLRIAALTDQRKTGGSDRSSGGGDVGCHVDTRLADRGQRRPAQLELAPGSYVTPAPAGEGSATATAACRRGRARGRPGLRRRRPATGLEAHGVRARRREAPSLDVVTGLAEGELTDGPGHGRSVLGSHGAPRVQTHRHVEVGAGGQRDEGGGNVQHVEDKPTTPPG